MSLLNTLIEALPLQPPQQALVAGAAGLVVAAVVAFWIHARVRPPRRGHRGEVLVPPPL